MTRFSKSLEIEKEIEILTAKPFQDKDHKEFSKIIKNLKISRIQWFQIKKETRTNAINVCSKIFSKKLQPSKNVTTTVITKSAHSRKG